MKRSQINRKLGDAVAFLDRWNVRLPRWALRSPADWARAGPEADEIRRCRLGWDVTDFGSGDFDRCGLVLFTLRNGQPGLPRGEAAKDYCEKLLLVGQEQVTPTHFHFSKMEDIINRAGGRLVIEIWNADRRTERPLSAPVTVSVDAVSRTVPAGAAVVLEPGESIALGPYVYHKFYGQAGGGMVLCGEVSRVNDDTRDNRFLDPLPRFPKIDEDAAPLYLLCTEYPPAHP